MTVKLKTDKGKPVEDNLEPRRGHEIWKDVPGYEGYYQVSNLGRVKSVARTIRGCNRHDYFDKKIPEKILSPRIDPYGYSMLTLWRDGKGKPLRKHELVLTVFVGPRPKGYQAAHLNGIPSDNRKENLAWVTPKENCSHKIKHGTHIFGEAAPSAVLKRKDISVIRHRREKGETYNSIAKDYDVTPSAIWLVATGKTWCQA